MDRPATVTPTEGVDFYDASNPRRVPLDELRARRQPLLESGKHAWVLGVFFDVSDNPEANLDSMHLGVERMIGFTAFHCLMCQVTYVTDIQDDPCFGSPDPS